MLETLIAVATGSALALVIRHVERRWKSEDDDERRVADQQATRAHDEKAVISDLLGALMQGDSAVVNLGLIPSLHVKGVAIDWDGVRRNQEIVERLTMELARARLYARNPAARPSLDELRDNLVRITGHLALITMGRPSKEFSGHYLEFHSAAGRAWQQLEEAYLEWDGSLAPNDVAVSDQVTFQTAAWWQRWLPRHDAYRRP